MSTKTATTTATLTITPEVWNLLAPELQAKLVTANPEMFMGVSVPVTAQAPAEKASAPVGEEKASWEEIAAHVHDRRMVRRESTKLGGLTRAERRALAEAHRAELSAAAKKSRAAYDRKWAALVKAHKAA